MYSKYHIQDHAREKDEKREKSPEDYYPITPKKVHKPTNSNENSGGVEQVGRGCVYERKANVI